MRCLDMLYLISPRWSYPLDSSPEVGQLQLWGGNRRYNSSLGESLFESRKFFLANDCDLMLRFCSVPWRPGNLGEHMTDRNS